MVSSAACAESSHSIFDSDMKTLLTVHKTYECLNVKPMGSKALYYGELLSTPELRTSDTQISIRTLYFEGMPYHGKPTRVFAFIGLPKASQDKKVPGIVLIHGGGGTAFESWVRLWNARGYAAIAIDTCGCVPVGSYDNWQRHQWAGPAGWGGFDQIDEPFQDQWSYHGVSDVLLANSLLRSLPEVDSERVGITGISWGGYLTCIAAGIDKRFRFAVSVYGCGFLGENSAWLDTFKGMGKEKADKWLATWDPSVFLKSVKTPMMWITGTNDSSYPIDSQQKSYRLPSGPRTLCIRTDMKHGHGGLGENPKEIHAFADSFCFKGAPLAHITEQGVESNHIWATFQSKSKITSAVLNFSKDTCNWPERKWESVQAVISGNRIFANIPSGAKVCYFNLIDTRGVVVSTEYIDTLLGEEN